MDLNHGDLEKMVMGVVWDYSDEFDGLMSVNQVWEKLNTNNSRKKWAYTTVKTILDRLVSKSQLQRIKCGKKFEYSAVTPKVEMAKNAIKKLATEYFGGDFAEMAEFVNTMAERKNKVKVHVYR